MWGIVSSIFLILYLIMIFYIGWRGWTYLGKSTTGVYRKIYWLFSSILFVTFPLAEFGEDILTYLGISEIAAMGWYSMIAVIYIFLLLILIDILRLIDKRLTLLPILIKGHPNTPKVLGILILSIVFLTLFYGTFNARNPVITHYKIESDRQAGGLRSLKIAMVSDTHYGEVINEQRLYKMVQMINELNPDLIVLAGDIIDGNIDGDEAKILINVFSEMNAKFGIYAVPGNHDRWARNSSYLTERFQEIGINVLKDEMVTVEDSFYIIGRDDPGWGNRSRKGLEELMNNLDSSFPVILLDHQPIDIQRAQEKNITLQLSGHTHAGQIFPSNLITGQIYELDWGLLKKNSYHLIVSSGFGTWGPPLRIGNNPEIVSITIDFP